MAHDMGSELNKSGIEGVAYRLYHDQEVFSEEQEKLFRGDTWCYLGLDAEIPNAGDFRSTYVGETPVVLTRGADGGINAWVNRCAHKGALICRSLRGHSSDGTFTCVYHQWAYDAKGTLIGVPFRRGLKGAGGYSQDFKLGEHGAQALRVSILNGMIFGSFSDQAPPLEDFLGEAMCANIRRVLNRPIKILGYARQYMHGNWKLYSENSRDSYHGGLLHLFYPTFGIYRQSQDSRSDVSEQGFHSLFSVFRPTGKEEYANFSSEANREMEGEARLQDPRVIEFKQDLDDNVALSIQSLFPSVVLQQIQNTLATRQVLPKSADETELVWTYFGFEDDDEEMIAHRLRNINLVGPAGLISMEDGEAVELCQDGTVGAEGLRSFIEMGGTSVEETVAPIGMDENNVRGFWRGYFSMMNGAI